MIKKNIDLLYTHSCAFVYTHHHHHPYQLCTCETLRSIMLHLAMKEAHVHHSHISPHAQLLEATFTFLVSLNRHNRPGNMLM